MEVTITKDEDLNEGRRISIENRSFTFPFDMTNDEILIEIRNLLEEELVEEKEFVKLDRSKVVRLTDTKIEVI